MLQKRPASGHIKPCSQLQMGFMKNMFMRNRLLPVLCPDKLVVRITGNKLNGDQKFTLSLHMSASFSFKSFYSKS